MKDPTICSETELIPLPKTKVVCKACEEYANAQLAKPVAVICCEGACSRGEIARRAANLLCFALAPEETARLCLGAAFTKDTGQRRLAREARRLIAIEGCDIKCATRMMLGVIPELNPEVVVADDHYHLRPIPFGIDELSEKDADRCAGKVAQYLAASLKG
jgi:uncharacterized metal-binding protein